MADSYADPGLGGVQIESIERVSFEGEAGELLVRIYAQDGRVKSRRDYQGRTPAETEGYELRDRLSAGG